MVDFISINQFSIEHIKDETKPFVFGTKFDLAGKPNVGFGSDDSHLHVFMTSLALLRNLKTTNQGPVVIFHN